MTRLKLILAVAFVLVFAAGAVVGTVQRFHMPPPPGRPNGSFLTSLLNLTPDQQQKMRAIWADQGPNNPHDSGDRDKRREFQHQRDDAIRALLTPAQRTQYEAIQKDYTDHLAEAQKERQQSFQQAVEKTKAILTPPQAEKYEKFLKDHRPDNGPPGPRWGGHHPPEPTSTPSTRPASE